jgi:hypothetical protein
LDKISSFHSSTHLSPYQEKNDDDEGSTEQDTEKEATTMKDSIPELCSTLSTMSCHAKKVKIDAISRKRLDNLYGVLEEVKKFIQVCLHMAREREAQVTEVTPLQHIKYAMTYLYWCHLLLFSKKLIFKP